MKFHAFLSLGSRWRKVFSNLLQSLYPWGMNHGQSFNRRLEELKSRCLQDGGDKINPNLAENKASSPTRSQ